MTSLRNAFRFWWLVVGLVIVGGLVGWAANRARPPLYEATAQFASGIDYVSTGPLTQFEEDTAYNTVGDIIFSANILKRVVEQANGMQIPTSMEELRSRTYFERRFNVWVLRVRDPDSRRAEQITNLWVEQARTALLQSYQHALLANQLDIRLQGQEKCLLNAVSNGPSNGICDRQHYADIQKEMQQTGKTLSAERIASRGMFAGLVPGEISQAVVAPRPVADQQNQYVLAGALLGLLLGVAFIELGLPARWIKRN